MKGNKSGMRNWTKNIAVIGLLVAAMFAAAVPVGAKSTYTFAGHPAVRYYELDFPSIKQWVDYIEYDTPNPVIAGPNKYGVRLYLKPAGRDAINAQSGSTALAAITSFITTRPEWKSDRSYVSIATEIAIHSEAAKLWYVRVYPTHIEYFYNDLNPWEKLGYGR